MTNLLDAAPTVVASHQTVPARVSSAGREAVELAADCGLILDPWQASVLDGALSEDGDGRWAAFEVGLIVPRQNGKGSVLEAREIAGLFLFGEQLILHSAHEFKTAQEAFRRVLQLVQSNRDLDRLIMRVRTSHGEEGIELKSGQRLRFVARSTGSGRGFTGDTVILDEAYKLSQTTLAALLPTMSARPNPQLWYTSSAPLPTVESEVLRKLCKRGRQGAGSLAYYEFCADKDADLDDPKAWAQANPAMPHRVSAEFVGRERQALDGEGFARERLGIWVDLLDTTEQVVSPEDWADRLDESSSVSGPLAFALDVSPDGGSAAIAVSDGTHVEVIEHRPRTGWVVDRLTALIDRWKPLTIALDPKGPAGSLLAQLQLAGIEVLAVNGAEHAQACGGFLDAVIEDRLTHIGQPPLEVAVAGATRRTLGDAWAWSRRHSTVDISPLVAVTLARWAVHRAEEDGPSVYEDRGFVSL